MRVPAIPAESSLPAIFLPPCVGNKDYSGGELLGAQFFCLADKPFGVEPGFLAMCIDDELVRLTNQVRADQTQLKSAEQFINYFTKKVDKAKSLAEAVKQLSRDGHVIHQWMFKQTYADPSLGGVRPPLERLQKVGTIRKLPQGLRQIGTLIYLIAKSYAGDFSTENTNAILECLATDIARAHGVFAQLQTFALSSYASGNPQVASACRIEDGLTDFTGLLRGDKGHEKYLIAVEKVSEDEVRRALGIAKDAKQKKLKEEDCVKQGFIVKNRVNGKQEYYRPIMRGDYYCSDNSLPLLGFDLPMLIYQFDRDALGSAGQNKGRIGNQVFFFDCGQAFRGPNTIVNTLSDDFSFVQPKGTKFIKNISVFYDTKLSSRMAGMVFMYMVSDKKTRAAAGFTEDQQKTMEAVIELYKKQVRGFRERAEKIRMGAEESLYDYYQNTFRDLAQKKAQSNDNVSATEFEKYASKILESKKNTSQARVKMLKVFRQRLLLSPAEVDLLNHLEQFSAKTTLLSNDGKVILNHLRLLPDTQNERNRVRWMMKKEEGKIKLGAVLPINKAKKLKTELEQYLQQCGLKNPPVLHILERNSKALLTTTCSPADLELLIRAFHESNVKHYKYIVDPLNHPKVALSRRVSEVIEKQAREFNDRKDEKFLKPRQPVTELLPAASAASVKDGAVKSLAATYSSAKAQVKPLPPLPVRITGMTVKSKAVVIEQPRTRPALPPRPIRPEAKAPQSASPILSNKKPAPALPPLPPVLKEAKNMPASVHTPKDFVVPPRDQVRGSVTERVIKVIPGADRTVVREKVVLANGAATVVGAKHSVERTTAQRVPEAVIVPAMSVPAKSQTSVIGSTPAPQPRVIAKPTKPQTIPTEAAMITMVVFSLTIPLIRLCFQFAFLLTPHPEKIKSKQNSSAKKASVRTSEAKIDWNFSIFRKPAVADARRKMPSLVHNPTSTVRGLQRA